MNKFKKKASCLSKAVFDRMCKWIKKTFIFLFNSLLYISSISAILSISHDDNFCELKQGLKSKDTGLLKENLRFSLINLYLGSVFLCIFTFSINSNVKERFKFWKVINLKDVVKKNNRKLLERSNSLVLQEGDDLSAKKELAQYDLSRILRRIDITQNKINSILTVILVFIPIIITNFAKFTYCHYNLLSCSRQYLFIIGSCAVFYSLICLIFLFCMNLNREFAESKKINLDEKVNIEKVIEFMRDESDFEEVRSISLATILLQIRRSIITLVISLTLILLAIVL